MNDTNENNPLGYEKLSVLLKRFAIPSIIAMVVSSLYNIVDQIFIGQGVGYLGNAATNVAFPLTTICLAITLLIPGVYSPIPMGAFYTVAKLPVDDSDKFCAWCLSDFEYEGQTVFMAPASGFYTTPGSGINEVRIAYVLKKEDLTRALFILQKALEVYPGRTE